MIFCRDSTVEAVYESFPIRIVYDQVRIVQHLQVRYVVVEVDC